MWFPFILGCVQQSNKCISQTVAVVNELNKLIDFDYFGLLGDENEDLEIFQYTPFLSAVYPKWHFIHALYNSLDKSGCKKELLAIKYNLNGKPLKTRLTKRAPDYKSTGYAFIQTLIFIYYQKMWVHPAPLSYFLQTYLPLQLQV